MSPKYTVWFVDDLPRNRATFEANHRNDFAIETFSKTSDVLTRIHGGDHPDALLCDIFFYDTAEEGERAEKAIADLAANLKKTATEIGVHDQMHAIGITLMQQIYEHFKNHPPPFPIYAYTSKGPFLLEQREWDRISEYGGKVLLKGRVTSDRERTEIIGDIELHRNENSPAAKMQSNVDWLFWTLVQGVFFIALSLSIGRWVRGTW